MTDRTATPSFLVMDRIEHFLRPMVQGGMGSGSEDFILRCLNLRPEVLRANIDALADQQRIRKLPDGAWIWGANAGGRKAKEAEDGR